MRRWAFTCVLATAALAGLAGPASAHRLDAQCFVRPGWLVQVESWYDTGEPPPGARVEVFRADGQLLTTGKLDKNGVFVFAFAEAETLKIVVTTVGHRAETTVPAEAMARVTTCTCVACLAPDPTPFLAAALLSPGARANNLAARTSSYSGPRADRGSTFPVGGALLGLAILFTIAAITRWRTTGVRRKRKRQNKTSKPAARK